MLRNILNKSHTALFILEVIACPGPDSHSPVVYLFEIYLVDPLSFGLGQSLIKYFFIIYFFVSLWA